MAEPAWKTLDPEPSADMLQDEEPGGGYVERLVRRPDGGFELLELPLTREIFLNPRLEDRIVQGGPHCMALQHVFSLVLQRFRPEKGALVLSDVKLRLGRGRPGPAPDLWVVRGHPKPSHKIRSYSVPKQGIPPCFILEVVSTDPELRDADEVDKVKLYERVGVRDYLMAELPCEETGYRLRLLGYRMGPDKRYQPIEPDEQGRLLSEATGLWFGISPDGEWIDVYDARTGERLHTLAEEVDARKAAEEKAERAEKRIARAEEKARREAVARKVAEAETERLRAEIERLKKSTG